MKLAGIGQSGRRGFWLLITPDEAARHLQGMWRTSCAKTFEKNAVQRLEKDI